MEHIDCFPSSESYDGIITPISNGHDEFQIKEPTMLEQYACNQAHIVYQIKQSTMPTRELQKKNQQEYQRLQRGSILKTEKRYQEYKLNQAEIFQEEESEKEGNDLVYDFAQRKEKKQGTTLADFEDLLENYKKIPKNTRGKKSTKKSEITRNMLQFFWKVFRKFFERLNHHQDHEIKENWQRIKNEKPSLEAFTAAFSNPKLRRSLARLFRTRFLIREIVGSNIRLVLKKCYLRHIDTLREGLANGRLLFLN